MKNLKKYIIESIFDIEDNIDNIDESIKDQIKQFLNNNFTISSKYEISKKPNKDGKFEVSSTGDVEAKNKLIISLTNELFIWTNIKGNFYCDDCNYCSSLISLEGAPEKVSGKFNCNSCHSLTSLEGAPKEVGGDFNCNGCESLISLKGAPEKVGGGFSCNYCKSLKSLKGAPKEVRKNFSCQYCGVEFTEKDVKNVSNVKGMIKV